MKTIPKAESVYVEVTDLSNWVWELLGLGLLKTHELFHTAGAS